MNLIAWLDSTYAEQPILAISHNEKNILKLYEEGIAHAFPGKQATSGNHPDAIVIRAEKNNITVKDITALKTILTTKPSSGKRLVFIPHAEQLLPESANMLLKTLEESGIATRFLLGSPAKRSVLTTIRSRCIILPISSQQISEDKNISVPELLEKYSAIRPTGAYTEEELADIAQLLHAYTNQFGSNPQLARMAIRLKEYYKTASVPGGNIKLASDILLASLSELRNTI
jgi:DNA polymerase III delta prime subunit